MGRESQLGRDKGDDMKICRRKTMLFLLALPVLIPALARASYGADRGRRPPEPPPQAFEACLDKSEGAAVELVSPRGDTMKAVCKTLGSRLVAVPEDPPPQGAPSKDEANEP
jgi:hypothetical protein